MDGACCRSVIAVAAFLTIRTQTQPCALHDMPGPRDAHQVCCSGRGGVASASASASRRKSSTAGWDAGGPRRGDLQSGRASTRAIRRRRRQSLIHEQCGKRDVSPSASQRDIRLSCRTARTSTSVARARHAACACPCRGAAGARAGWRPRPPRGMPRNQG